MHVSCYAFHVYRIGVEGGNFIRTHVKLMSYMTFQLTLCLMKWNCGVIHACLFFRLRRCAIHNVNYIRCSTSIFFLCLFCLSLIKKATSMKNNPGALASVKINIFIIILQWNIREGERFKTIDLYDTSDILGAYIKTKKNLPTKSWFIGIRFWFVENLVARELLTI